MADNQTTRYDEILSTYKNISRIPFIEYGWVKPELPTAVMIQYSQRDLVRNKKNSILRAFFEGDSFSFKPYPFAMNMSNVVMVQPSPSWSYLAVLRSIKEKGDEEEKYILEIWDNGCIAVSIPTEGKHAQIYTDSFFGSLVWSHDEKFIAYIAERNPTKTSTFFNLKDDDENPGSKFELKEDWGETYKGGNPCIFIASIEDEKINLVPGIPLNLSAGQVQWANDNKHLVFTGWQTEPRRLGIVYCYNRPSSIYSVPIDKESIFSNKTQKDNLCVLLTKENLVSRSSRFSGDGKILIYLASNEMKTHNTSSKLMKINWTESLDINLTSIKETTVIDIVKTFPKDPSDFPGLFISNLPSRCFIEDRKIILSTNWRSQIIPLLIDLETSIIRKISIPGCANSNLNVQNVRKDVCALFDGSEINRVPFTFVGRWDSKKLIFKNWKVTPHPPSITELAIDLTGIDWETRVVKLEATGLNEQKKIPEFEYLITFPNNEKIKFPVILFPHGGPHNVSIPIFSLFNSFFASLGYAIINVNYRGSLGFGKDFVDSLPGNCGQIDVDDCISALKSALKEFPEKLDETNLFVIGGSHGGFLTGHLLARPEINWKAGVIINGVTNMAHCVGISDIPDWCYVESGSHNLRQGLQHMFEVSPISSVQNVKCPTLIVCGDADKRVPMSQSIEYYHALKENGVVTKLLKYPGAGHAISEPEQEADYLINSALWFDKYLK